MPLLNVQGLLYLAAGILAARLLARTRARNGAELTNSRLAAAAGGGRPG